VTWRQSSSTPLASKVALNHYKQALDSLNHHNYEASNGALRPMLEDVTSRVAQTDGYMGTSAATPTSWSTRKKKTVSETWGRLLEGAWDIWRSDGPHPG
jgi:hypothetical protein